MISHRFYTDELLLYADRAEQFFNFISKHQGSFQHRSHSHSRYYTRTYSYITRTAPNTIYLLKRIFHPFSSPYLVCIISARYSLYFHWIRQQYWYNLIRESTIDSSIHYLNYCRDFQVFLLKRCFYFAKEQVLTFICITCTIIYIL